jgi:hypothetical protein
MPPGRVHARHTLELLNVAPALVGLLFGQDPLAMVFAAVGVLSGVIMSPDLDCRDGYYGLYVIRKTPKIGKVLVFIWRALWYPYGLIIPHRSWISHAPVIGTMLRVIYLMLWIWLFGAIFGHGKAPDTPGGLFYPWLWGLMAADILHFIEDHHVKPVAAPAGTRDDFPDLPPPPAHLEQPDLPFNSV